MINKINRRFEYHSEQPFPEGSFKLEIYDKNKYARLKRTFGSIAELQNSIQSFWDALEHYIHLYSNIAVRDSPHFQGEFELLEKDPYGNRWYPIAKIVFDAPRIASTHSHHAPSQPNTNAIASERSEPTLTPREKELHLLYERLFRDDLNELEQVLHRSPVN